MVTRKSKIVISTVLVLFILLMGAVYIYLNTFNAFNISNSNSAPNYIKPGYGVVSDSQFKIIDSWYQDYQTGYQSSAKLKFNGSTGNAVLMVMVNQYSNQPAYLQSQEELNQKTLWHVVSKEDTVKAGIPVKTITVARDEGGELLKEFFFQKNGKYYQIVIDIAGDDSNQFFSNAKYMLDDLVNTVIETIN